MSSDKDILDQYYLSLKEVDARYRELEEARSQNIWYEGKLREADQLSTQYGFGKASSLSISEPVVIYQLDRTNVESKLLELSGYLQKYRELKVELNQLIDSYKERLDRLMKELEAKANNITEEINDLNVKTRTVSGERANNILYVTVVYLVFAIGVAILPDISFLIKILITSISFLVVAFFVFRLFD
jgi:chromosome segregation ATPase